MNHTKTILTLFLGLLVFSCAPKKPSGQENILMAEPAVPVVDILECRIGEYVRTIETFGTISYVTKAEIYPMGAEIIDRMNYEEGDSVRVGEELARLDSRKLSFQLKEAESGIRIKETRWNLAVQQREEGRRNMESRFLEIENARLDLEKARIDFQRISRIFENKKQLFEVEGISQEEMASVELEYQEKDFACRKAESALAVKKIGFRKEDLIQAGYEIPENPANQKELFIDYNTRMLQAEVDVAAAELEAARSQVEALRLYLSETSIRAPISGVIGRKYMESGEKASPEKPLYLIFPENSVYAEARVSEKELTVLKQGMQGDVTSDTDTQMRTGRIQRISPWVDQESRTGSFKILLDNRDGLFKVGQFVRISLRLTGTREGILLPSQAILSKEGITRVFQIRGNRIFEREISCLDPVDDQIPVESGLEPGNLIVLNPSEGLRNGMEVSLP